MHIFTNETAMSKGWNEWKTIKIAVHGQSILLTSNVLNRTSTDPWKHQRWDPVSRKRKDPCFPVTPLWALFLSSRHEMGGSILSVISSVSLPNVFNNEPILRFPLSVDDQIRVPCPLIYFQQVFVLRLPKFLIINCFLGPFSCFSLRWKADF